MINKYLKHMSNKQQAREQGTDVSAERKPAASRAATPK